MTIDVVCHVVDNYGDIAVVWRLAQALLEDGPEDLSLRLLVDDWVSFRALNPLVDPEAAVQTLPCAGRTVTALRVSALDQLDNERRQAADVLVEAFGAPTPVVWLEPFLAAAAEGRRRTILHLEYLTAETWSESYHRLPSPLGRPGVDRFFFVPGFRAAAGGLVFTDYQPAPLRPGEEDWLMTLFSYEHDFTSFWEDLAEFLEERKQSARVLVFGGRSRAGALASWERVRAHRGPLPSITVVDQPFVDQETYTALVRGGDFHVVRGEESLVQAILAGHPFLWQAYLQPEGHQRVKVQALLEVWKPWFEKEGPQGVLVYEKVAREFDAFNERNANSDADPPRERYKVFWEYHDLLTRIGHAWASELRKSSKLSRKMLDFLKSSRI